MLSTGIGPAATLIYGIAAHDHLFNYSLDRT